MSDNKPYDLVQRLVNDRQHSASLSAVIPVFCCNISNRIHTDYWLTGHLPVFCKMRKACSRYQLV